MEKIVMVTGHFDPFHDGHLDYVKQALDWMSREDTLYCVVSTDRQLMMKKGRVNIPEQGRWEIVELILKTLCWQRGVHVWVTLNKWDTETTLIAEALRICEPTVLFRGSDKTTATMPDVERQRCLDMGIEIMHAKKRIENHGAFFR